MPETSPTSRPSFCVHGHIDCPEPEVCNNDPDLECADCGQTRVNCSCGEFVLPIPAQF